MCTYNAISSHTDHFEIQKRDSEKSLLTFVNLFPSKFCSFETRCSTCKEWTSAIRTLVAKRRTSMGRKKSTEDKKRDMGAPGTLETQSKVRIKITIRM